MSNFLNKIIKGCIYLTVFLLPLFVLSFTFEVFEFNKQYLLFFLSSFGLFLWIVKMIIVEKEIKFQKTPLDLPILGLMAIGIISAIFSIDKSSSWIGFYGRFSDSLMTLLPLGVLYFLITNHVTAREDKPEGRIKVSSLVKTFTWSIFFVILASIFSIFGVWSLFAKLFGSMPAIMLQNIFNPIAGSMEGLAVFLAAFIAFLSVNIITTEKKKIAKIASWILLLSSLFLIVIIDFTPAWITLLVSLLIFVGIALYKRIFRENINKMLVPVFLAIISIAFLFINVSNIQSSIFQLPKEQTLSQGTSWQVAFKSDFKDVKSVFLGSGPGTFHYDFAKFKPKSFNQDLLWQIRFDRSGSYVSELLATMGILGFLCFLTIVGMFLLISWLFLETAIEKKTNSLPFLSLFIAVLALFIGQLVYYQNIVLAFAFWFLLALSVVSWQKSITGKTISFKGFPELSLIFSAVLIILGLGILGMYFFVARFYVADINCRTAIKNGKVEYLEKAAALNPYQPQYKTALARTYLSEALAELNKTEGERDQDLLTTKIYQAITYAKGGQLGSGYVKGATEVAPNRVSSWETAGMIYRDISGTTAGAVEWGIKDFTKAIELEPLNPVLHTELGKLYLMSDKKDMAKDEFNKAKELKSDYVDALIQLSLIYEQDKDLDGAVREMEAVSVLYPYDTDVLFQLGRLYFNQNRTDDAIAKFKSIIELIPNHSNALYSLGVAYEKKGNTTKALEAYEKVLELNPDNTEIQAKVDSLKK